VCRSLEKSAVLLSKHVGQVVQEGRKVRSFVPPTPGRLERRLLSMKITVVGRLQFTLAVEQQLSDIRCARPPRQQHVPIFLPRSNEPLRHRRARAIDAGRSPPRLPSTETSSSSGTKATPKHLQQLTFEVLDSKSTPHAGSAINRSAKVATFLAPNAQYVMIPRNFPKPGTGASVQQSAHAK
jgi:hypothetical protein